MSKARATTLRERALSSMIRQSTVDAMLALGAKALAGGMTQATCGN
jgi:hypothetical protein